MWLLSSIKMASITVIIFFLNLTKPHYILNPIYSVISCSLINLNMFRTLADLNSAKLSSLFWLLTQYKEQVTNTIWWYISLISDCRYIYAQKAVHGQNETNSHWEEEITQEINVFWKFSYRVTFASLISLAVSEVSFNSCFMILGWN